MKKVLFILVVAAICLAAGNAHAFTVPTVDGLIGFGLGNPADEWANYFLQGHDINEGDITDNWDIQHVWMKEVTGQVSGNGLYFRMDMYDTPAFAGAPGAGSQEAYFEFWFDTNGDGLEEYYIDFNDQQDSEARLLGLYKVQAGPDPKLGFGTAALGNIIEMYIPDTLFSPYFTAGGNFQLYGVSDGRGSEDDDRLPNSGWVKTPEPGSAMLLGLGLFGMIGGLIRRKFKA